MIATRRLKNVIDQTFYAAKLRLCFKSSPVIVQRLKDRLPAFSASYCVYSFACSCRASYVGKTTRRLSERVKEHHPAWLSHGVTKSVNSAIVAHLSDTSHSVNVSEAFRPIDRVPGLYSRPVRCRLLSAAEAIAIRLHHPNLCSHTRFVQAVGLL